MCTISITGAAGIMEHSDPAPWQHPVAYRHLDDNSDAPPTSLGCRCGPGATREAVVPLALPRRGRNRPLYSTSWPGRLSSGSEVRTAGIVPSRPAW